MELKRFEQAAEFAAAAEEFLTTHEAHNNLVLGLTVQLREPQEPGALPPYFAVVSDGGDVLAAALMTPPRRFVLARTERPEALDLLVRDVHQARPDVPGVTGPVPASGWFAERWQAMTGQTATRSMAERIYQLTRVKPPQGVPGQARRATEADRGVLAAWLTAFEEEAFGAVFMDGAAHADRFLKSRLRGLYLWEHGGNVVSLAGFGGPTPNGIRIGPVYTPPEWRGRGYASACVARLSQDMLDGGRKYCFLFTDLANPTSNHIYQAIGYEPVVDVDEYRFG
jgi:predicted GNAT family acetyltransferase